MKSFNQFIKSRDKSLYREFSEMARVNTQSNMQRVDDEAKEKLISTMKEAIAKIDTLLDDSKNPNIYKYNFPTGPYDREGHPYGKDNGPESHGQEYVVEQGRKMRDAILSQWHKIDMEGNMEQLFAIISYCGVLTTHRNPGITVNFDGSNRQSKDYNVNLERYIKEPLEQIETLLQDELRKMEAKESPQGTPLNPADRPEM